jgi:predicted ABC-class ATPase
MGIRRGVTVITGGGYSGKSTVLNAVSAGVYNHVARDGRELCITDGSAATITAEDGRAVSRLNISPFIKWIPGGEADNFSTSHASGSTSQAANIMEAVDCGAKLLLIDEDRSATNFMIRDALMRELIKKEPITPFTDRARELAKRGVSTVLVIGGSGEYLSVADKIYMMDDFTISDATERAKKVSPSVPEPPDKAEWATNRAMFSGGFTSYPDGAGTERLEVSDTGFIIIGDERIDIRALHDIATPAQVNALAFMLRYLECYDEEDDELEKLAYAMRGINHKTAERKIDAAECVKNLFVQIGNENLNIVDTGFFTAMSRFMDMPREFELRAAINRMRRVGWTV